MPQGLRVTTHILDVADRTQVERFRDEVADRHQTDKIHLLFNNAGISGGGSMVTNSRDEWERTFNICWGGVYNCTRAFLPMLQNAEESHIVNRHCQINFCRARSAERNTRSRCGNRISPLIRRLGAEDPERRARDEMALKVEGVVNGGMHAGKTLDGAS